MEQLRRFDIAVHREVAMVVVESELLPPDPAVIVIPLLRNYPTVLHLNPTIQIGEEPFILATRLIGAVRRSSLKRTGNVAEQSDKITRAIDILMAGV